MKAVVFDGVPRLEDIPMPEPRRGEALVRVLTAGICRTDQEIFRGYMQFNGVPGHEFVGIVEECSNSHLKGKRVVGEINCVCHRCHYCHLEMTHHCLNRTVLGIQGRNGAFAEYISIPEENLHIVPNSIRDDVAAFAEPVAAAFRILEQVRITQDSRVIVLGDGKLGMLCAQVLWLHTKRLLCIGKHPWKLDLLKDLHISIAHSGDPVERGADFVIDATGSPDGLQRALELVRPEGTIVLKTTCTQPMTIHLSGPVVSEVKIIGSRCGPFRPALDALAMGNVEVRPMISETYELNDALHAFERASAHDVIKVLIHI